MTATRERPRVIRTQVDPRLAERRREVADGDRQRRRRALVLLLLVSGVVGAMVAVLFSPLLDVDHLRVEGTGSIGVEEVAAASGLELGDRMVEVDLAEVRDALLGVPGIRSARVTREWPSTVRVVISEEVPLAEVRSGERRLVVSSTGTVLEAPGAADRPLVPVEVEALELDAGPRPGEQVVADEVLAAAQTVDRMVGPAREQVAAAHLSDAGSLSLVLTDGAVVHFGPVEGLPAKLGAAEAVLGQVEPQCRDVIDVREPSRVTVSRKPGCEPAPVTDTTVAPGQVEG